MFAVGFLGLVVIGYVLHKAGFFMETTIETFDQQSKLLYERQVRYSAAAIAKYIRMDDDELEQEINEAKGALRL